MSAPQPPPGTAPQTPSQTIGPYFSMILAHDEGEAVVAGPDVPGERIVLAGRVLDGDGEPVEDGLVELWQADANGRYRHPFDTRTEPPLHPGFTGFGRTKTAFDSGEWAFTTVRPGSVPAADGTPQAPHVSLVVQSRGMLDPVWTRAYLEDEEQANAADPVLAAVPEDRRATLVARRDGEQDGLPRFRLDIHLQGEHETVFLDW